MRKIEWRFRFVSIGEERALRDFWFFSFLFFFPIIRAPRKQKKKTKASKKAEREREGALQKRKKRKSHSSLLFSFLSPHLTLKHAHTAHTNKRMAGARFLLFLPRGQWGESVSSFLFV
jgi:hypothetical protein